MSDYPYNDYNGANQNGPGNGDLPYWIVSVVFLFVFPPVGVLMLALKLFGGGKRRGRHPYYAQREGQPPMGARTAARANAAPQAQPGRQAGAGTMNYDPMGRLARRGKALTVWGTALIALFGFVSMMEFGSNLSWMFSHPLDFVETMLPMLTFTAGGAGLLWAGVRKRKQAQRYRKYLAMIGRRQMLSISSLSAAMGLPSGRVREDLEDMLNLGLFPTGYLDYGGDMLVLSGEGIQDTPPQSERPAAPKAPQAGSQENTVLAEIRAVNDDIDNVKLSAQIDRIGVITARIFDYQKSHPDKSPQLHSFLSYYLPTTLKILRAYAQLEDQEAAGDNIAAAMARIEGMMDKVVEGFEKQLDQLFQGDVLDITTDVEVLERMLAKDGLSDHSGLQLGG